MQARSGIGRFGCFFRIEKQNGSCSLVGGKWILSISKLRKLRWVHRWVSVSFAYSKMDGGVFGTRRRRCGAAGPHSSATAKRRGRKLANATAHKRNLLRQMAKAASRSK
ncbi:hypothetical protein TRVL_09839 [Trypanosoma vivax]|nr:hypothetical protein TRVL_09839 [Trypanosoma vivax]